MAFRTVVGTLVLLGSILTFSIVQYIHSHRHGPLLESLLRPLSVLFLLNYVWTILRWITYVPQSGITEDDLLPRIDVVIPAYNESAFIRESMESVMLSNYPREKLHLIVVDDGSTDDTWYHIDAASGASLEAQIKCTIKKHEQNAGKRQALVTGVKQGDHEILVTLDSDSILARDTLRNLVTPLVLDQSVGGVAGHLAVANTGDPSCHSWQALIPRLLHILFEYGGNLPRSAQTKSGFVVILPGAISAFRRRAIKSHIEGLGHQTFMGHELRHGEDIELAMKLLQAGWRTVYQSNAIIHTTAPETAYKAILMYIRWERSSYTYLLRGLLRLTFLEAFQLLKITRLWARGCVRVLPLTHKADDDAAELSAARDSGDLYPFLNLVCTSLSSITYIGLMILRFMSLIKEPHMVGADLLCMVIFATWTSLIFIADALRDDMHFMAAAKDSNNADRVAEATDGVLKLIWKLQYASLSVFFQTFFIGWASIIGILTLRSQSWLTR